MPASSTRLAAAAVVIALLALAGGLGWQHWRPSSSAHVEMLALMPGAGRATPPSAPATRSESVPAASRPNVDAARQNGPPPPTAPQIGTAAAPSFDIVRVEPSGEALLAGRGTPNGTVALVDRGKVVATTKADAGGNFVMTPPALKPGDYALSLSEGQGAAARESKQSVVVSVPKSKSQQVVVALAEPGKATTLLSAPPKPEAAATPAKGAAPVTDAKPATSDTKLAIHSVELENGSGLFASGTAPPGSDVRLYLNDSRVADVIAAAAGAWTVEVRKGLTAGRYAVRADSLKPDQSVGARVEVPFEVPPTQTAEVAAADSASVAPPARPAAAAPQSDMAPASKAPQQTNAVVDEIQTDLVSRGDNLWRISRKRLGHGTRYTEIYAANIGQIRDPKLVYPGQVFVLPQQ